MLPSKHSSLLSPYCSLTLTYCSKTLNLISILFESHLMATLDMLSLWKQAFVQTPASEKPATCASALKKCDSCIFPNVYTLLKIACTIPVTSCECERNASTLWRLRNFMRYSMIEDSRIAGAFFLECVVIYTCAPMSTILLCHGHSLHKNTSNRTFNYL